MLAAITGELAGSAPMSRTPGRCALRSAPTPAISPPPPTEAAIPDSLHWVRNSAEYRAATLQAFRLATARIEEAAQILAKARERLGQVMRLYRSSQKLARLRFGLLLPLVEYGDSETCLVAVDLVMMGGAQPDAVVGRSPLFRRERRVGGEQRLGYVGAGTEGESEAQAAGDGAPYCIMLPPPNVTGGLHMGHAITASIARPSTSLSPVPYAGGVSRRASAISLVKPSLRSA